MFVFCKTASVIIRGVSFYSLPRKRLMKLFSSGLDGTRNMLYVYLPSDLDYDATALPCVNLITLGTVNTN